MNESIGKKRRGAFTTTTVLMHNLTRQLDVEEMIRNSVNDAAKPAFDSKRG